MSVFCFSAIAIGTDQLCFVYLMSSLQTLGVFVYHLRGKNGVQCFYLLDCNFWFYESLASRNESFFLFNIDETADRRDTISCFHFADSILIIYFSQTLSLSYKKATYFRSLTYHLKKLTLKQQSFFSLFEKLTTTRRLTSLPFFSHRFLIVQSLSNYDIYIEMLTQGSSLF